MRKTYLQPETEAVNLVYDSSFLQSGESGTGQGSDMDDPDETQNPF
jgi:hypothetical protein